MGCLYPDKCKPFLHGVNKWWTVQCDMHCYQWGFGYWWIFNRYCLRRWVNGKGDGWKKQCVRNWLTHELATCCRAEEERRRSLLNTKLQYRSGMWKVNSCLASLPDEMTGDEHAHTHTHTHTHTTDICFKIGIWQFLTFSRVLVNFHYYFAHKSVLSLSPMAIPTQNAIYTAAING